MSDDEIRTSLEDDAMKYKYKVHCHNCREKSIRWFDLGNRVQDLFCDGCQQRAVIENKGQGYGSSIEVYLKLDKGKSEGGFSLKKV